MFYIIYSHLYPKMENHPGDYLIFDPLHYSRVFYVVIIIYLKHHLSFYILKNNDCVLICPYEIGVHT